MQVLTDSSFVLYSYEFVGILRAVQGRDHGVKTRLTPLIFLEIHVRNYNWNLSAQICEAIQHISISRGSMLSAHCLRCRHFTTNLISKIRIELEFLVRTLSKLSYRKI